MCHACCPSKAGSNPLVLALLPAHAFISISRSSSLLARRSQTTLPLCLAVKELEQVDFEDDLSNGGVHPIERATTLRVEARSERVGVVGDRERMFGCALCEYLRPCHCASKGAGVINRCVSECAQTRVRCCTCPGIVPTQAADIKCGGGESSVDIIVVAYAPLPRIHDKPLFFQLSYL